MQETVSANVQRSTIGSRCVAWYARSAGPHAWWDLSDSHVRRRIPAERRAQRQHRRYRSRPPWRLGDRLTCGQARHGRRADGLEFTTIPAVPNNRWQRTAQCGACHCTVPLTLENYSGAPFTPADVEGAHFANAPGSTTDSLRTPLGLRDQSGAKPPHFRGSKFRGVSRRTDRSKHSAESSAPVPPPEGATAGPGVTTIGAVNGASS